MKKLIFLLGLTICGLVASAQPTSMGGITPWKTTLEELKELVERSDSLSDGTLSVDLKQPEGQHAWVRQQNGVVYKVSALDQTSGKVHHES